MATLNFNDDKLDELFPVPAPAPSPLSPTRIPGVTSESSNALAKVLKDNHRRWHAFFNDRGFHNHASHHMVAIFALGASGPLIEAAYDTHVAYMRPAYPSPEAISETNFYEHLGERDYYNAYLQFFTSKLLSKGVSETMEEYIFSRSANAGPALMLPRFLATILHPMIHAGCGVEFGLLGLVAEGLAQATVHPAQAAGLMPLSLWDVKTHVDSRVNTLASRLSSLLPSLTLDRSARPKAEEPQSSNSNTGTHVFSILARILHDDRFTPAALGLPPPEAAALHVLERVEKNVGEPLLKYIDEWTVDGADARDVEKKIEELAWMNALLYGVGGWAGRSAAPTGKFNADFFLMHLVTSSIFLPSLVAYLSPESTFLLLRTYLTVSLTWWVARGRPALPIKEFFTNTTAMPRQPGEPHNTPAQKALTPAEPAPNPWLPIIQTTLVHPGEHLCKLQRALAHFAVLYGARPKGHFSSFAEAGDPAARLEGVEELDGSLFVRAAGLTADRMGWMREGQEEGEWDRVGFW
ncbi:hypothetical protein CERSUDRAFT_115740 [Gelatoporia subvermispora B]|uniref:Uncharacterized protein n=1 Tax=Ceriporiopsis subvermispora (strain B) TaxID=914234 RepID=M2RBK0_CERS8|nr:hypothetical protein CERSUDRAFT_115740 [Gelatoporia subvermispora B]